MRVFSSLVRQVCRKCTKPCPRSPPTWKQKKLQSLSQQRALLGSALSSTQGAKGSAPPPPHHQCPSQVRWPIHRSIQQRRVLNHRRHRKPPGPGNPAIRHMPPGLMNLPMLTSPDAQTPWIPWLLHARKAKARRPRFAPQATWSAPAQERWTKDSPWLQGLPPC